MEPQEEYKLDWASVAWRAVVTGLAGMGAGLVIVSIAHQLQLMAVCS